MGEAHDARSGVSGWELWERREREEERRAAELGARDGLPLFLPTPYFAASAEEEQRAGHDFLSSFFCSFFLPFPPVCCNLFFSWDRPGRRAKGCLQRAVVCGLRTGNELYILLAMIYQGRMRSNE